jgi:hypothetical protein
VSHTVPVATFQSADDGLPQTNQNGADWWPIDYVELDVSGLDIKGITPTRNTLASQPRLTGVDKAPWVGFMGNFTGLRVGNTQRLNASTGNMVSYPVGPGSVIPWPSRPGSTRRKMGRRGGGQVDMYLYQETNNGTVGIGTGLVAIGLFKTEQAARLWCASNQQPKFVSNLNSTGGSIGANTLRSCVEDGWYPIRADVLVNLATIQSNTIYTVPTGKIFEATYFCATTASATTAGTTIQWTQSAIAALLSTSAIGINAAAGISLFGASFPPVGFQNDIFAINVPAGSTGTGTVNFALFGKERQIE